MGPCKRKPGLHSCQQDCQRSLSSCARWLLWLEPTPGEEHEPGWQPFFIPNAPRTGLLRDASGHSGRKLQCCQRSHDLLSERSMSIDTTSTSEAADMQAMRIAMACRPDQAHGGSGQHGPCHVFDCRVSTCTETQCLQVRFKYVDDLASVWCEWAEMELQHKQFKRALDLMRSATTAPVSFDRRKVC